jgi:hypothetical protein
LEQRYFSKWEAKLKRQRELHAAGNAPDHLNNPKIPWRFIKKVGVKVWPEHDVPLPSQVERGLEMTEKLD